MTLMRSITQPWQCKDGRWYLPHFNLPHLHDRVIGVLGCASNADAVAKAISKWDSHDLESYGGAGFCGAELGGGEVTATTAIREICDPWGGLGSG